LEAGVRKQIGAQSSPERKRQRYQERNEEVMLSPKTRIGAYIASCAVAALLSVPSVGQALWSDDESVASDGGEVTITAYGSPDSTVELAYDTDGPDYSGPESVTIPAGESSVSFDVEVGAGWWGQSVWVGMSSDTTLGACTIWLE
jgi:hypothetical protein